jgi:hypothetical protein
MILSFSLQMLKKPFEVAVHFVRAYELLTRNAWFVEAEPMDLERLKSLSGIKI